METVNKAVSERTCIAEPNCGDTDDLNSGVSKFASAFSWAFCILLILAFACYHCTRKPLVTFYCFAGLFAIQKLVDKVLGLMLFNDLKVNRKSWLIIYR